MCNLNVIVKKTGIDVTERLANASAVSYAGNSDADGIFVSASGEVKKSQRKLNYRKMQDDIIKSNFILSHQRIATSGHTPEFNHPFSDERWVLIHNGVFHKYDKDKSDTATFFAAFQEAVKKLDEKGKERPMISVVQEALDAVGGGSYSVFIFDKVKQRGYYFKETGTRMEGIRLEDGTLYLSTEYRNMKFFKHVQHTLRIDACHLYLFLIKRDGTPEWYDMGEFKDPPYSYSSVDDDWEMRGSSNFRKGWQGYPSRSCERTLPPRGDVGDTTPKETKKEPTNELFPLESLLPTEEEMKLQATCKHFNIHMYDNYYLCNLCGKMMDEEEYERVMDTRYDVMMRDCG